MTFGQIIQNLFHSNKVLKGNLKTDTPRFDTFVYYWKNSYGKEALKTAIKLSFSKYFGFGSTMQNVLKLTGKPAFIMENRPFDLDILVYIHKIRGFDVRFELHFQKNELFFIGYTYYDIPDIEKENVIKTFAEKYQVNTNSVSVFDKIILDKYGNGLIFGNDSHFSVNFLAPNSKVESLSGSYQMDKQRVI